MTDAIAIVLAYLIGSFPTGFVMTRLITGEDLRAVGSGGTGATNARRALGSTWGAVVALIDVLKGVLAVVIARWLGADDLTVALAGILVVVAHCWPVWLGFRGGKGVATGAGAAFALSLWALLLIPILVIPVVLTRYVSLGSLTAAISAPILFSVLAATGAAPSEYVVFAVVVAGLIVWRHRENIERLRAGTERRLSGQPRTTGGA
ncbi:MAG TPA: glycerol-3-phosphate 1-O-acyltransferase PlsY [Thermomicrobiales bacterium]|nr:glycerol-3-phosphate 1-O-acyltransferase PlsY [Thermomicrobiales bacterium]